MKNITLSIALLLCSFTTIAQVNLLHTFNGSTTTAAGYYVEKIDRYICSEGNTINIYNPDFSLEKSITVGVPAGYSISSTSLSQHTFNSDDKYEICVYSSKSDGQNYNSNMRAMIVNEDGALIKDLGYAYSLYGSYTIIDDQLRFIVTKLFFDGSTVSQTTEIYSCNGSYTEVSSNSTIPNSKPYPNPTSTIINIPYDIPQNTISEMKIFSSNGQLIDVKTIGSHFNHIQLNVQDYQPGIYLYEYNGIREKFIVQ